MNDTVHVIAGTDETGLHVDPEQLARAGITPGGRAVIEIRPYTEEDWGADGERTSPSGEDFLAYLGVCPSHAGEQRCRPTTPLRRSGGRSRSSTLAPTSPS